MIESFVAPAADEGFDEIRYYNMHGAEVTCDP
jgi:hypothetical protein